MMLAASSFLSQMPGQDLVGQTPVSCHLQHSLQPRKKRHSCGYYLHAAEEKCFKCFSFRLEQDPIVPTKIARFRLVGHSCAGSRTEKLKLRLMDSIMTINIINSDEIVKTIKFYRSVYWVSKTKGNSKLSGITPPYSLQPNILQRATLLS